VRLTIFETHGNTTQTYLNQVCFHTQLSQENMASEPVIEFETHKTSLISYSKDNQLLGFQHSHLNHAEKSTPEACLLKLQKLRAFANNQS